MVQNCCTDEGMKGHHNRLTRPIEDQTLSQAWRVRTTECPSAELQETPMFKAW